MRIIATVAAFCMLPACGILAPKTEASFLQRGRDLLAAKDYSRAVLEFQNAARLAPKDGEPYYQIGLARLGSLDYRAAMLAFQRCLELNPSHTEARFKLAEMMSTSTQPDTLSKAAAQLKELLTLSPQNAEAADALALTEWRLGNREEAIDRLQKLLKDLPASLSSSVLLARMKLNANDLAGAEQILQSAASTAPESSDAALALGELHLIAGKTAQAETEIRRAIQLKRENVQALLALAAIQSTAHNWEAAEQTYGQISALPDKQYKSLHALFLFQHGKREEAIRELKALTQRDRDDRTSRTRLIAAYLESGNGAEAQKLLSDALTRNPKDADALMQHAALAIRFGRPMEARTDLQQVLQFWPDHAEAHRAMARADKALGQSQDERRELLEALRLRPELLSARVALARNYTTANEPKAALQVLEAAPAAQQQLLTILVERNWALLAMGDLAALKTALGNALAVGRYPDLVLQEALLQMAAGEYPAARAAAEEVLKTNSADVRAARVVAESYAAQNQTPAAIRRLAELVQQHPDSAPVRHLFGVWQVAAGDLSQARQQFEAARAADPSFTAAETALADLDRRHGDLAAARKRLNALVQREPGNLGAVLLLAEIESADGDHKAALAHYRAVLAQDSSNLMALNNISNELKTSGPDEALGFAQRALEIAPRNPAVQDTLGWIYYRKGMYTTALPYLNGAVASGSSPLRQIHLALCYIKAGEERTGREMLRAVLVKDPSLRAKVAELSSPALVRD